jgi:hypothetical protein
MMLAHNHTVDTIEGGAAMHWGPGFRFRNGGEVPPDGVNGRNRRVAERFDISCPVTVGRYGYSVVEGTTLNLSTMGAAIQIEDATGERAMQWARRLDHGEGLWIVGLLDHPVSAWVVLFDDGVLRVHFADDELLRSGMRARINELLRGPS